VDRVHGDVTGRAAAVAYLLAVVEHRRLVLLTLADYHDAVHRDGVDEQPHRVHRGPVGAVLVSPADPPGGRHRACLGDPDQFQGQVPVRRLAFRLGNLDHRRAWFTRQGSWVVIGHGGRLPSRANNV